jgi:hypothetical protein
MAATRTRRNNTPTPPAPAAANGSPRSPQASAPGTPDHPTGRDTTRGGPSSQERVLTALAGRPRGATVTELATITGLGNSTVGKALTAAETDAKVTRAPGGRDGARRAPDTWTLRTTTTTAPRKTTAPVPNPDTASSTTPAAPPHTAADNAAASNPATEPAAAAPGTASSGNRLGKGQLADLTLAWLRDNPGEHTASAVGKATGRSSGAIANALAKMADTGAVRLVSERPRRYAATPA